MSSMLTEDPYYIHYVGKQSVKDFILSKNKYVTFLFCFSSQTF